MTTKIQSWDGTRKTFDDEASAFAWAREHLRNWMEQGDRIKRWQTDAGNTVLAVFDCGEATDACVLIEAAP